MSEIRRRIARETKIGLVVITLLLILFAVVLVHRLRRGASATDAPIAQQAQSEQPEATEPDQPVQSAVLVSGVAGSQAPVSGGYEQSAASSEADWKSHRQRYGDDHPHAQPSERYALMPGEPEQTTSQQAVAAGEPSAAVAQDAAYDALPVQQAAPAELRIRDSRQLGPESTTEPALPIEPSADSGVQQDAGYPDVAQDGQPQGRLMLRAPEISPVQQSRYQQAPVAQQSPATPYAQTDDVAARSPYGSDPIIAQTSPAQSSIAQQPISAGSVGAYEDQTTPLSGGTSYSAQASDGSYVVQPNDNFWSISNKIYGSGSFFKALMKYNEQRHPLPERLAVGDKILAPPKSELMESFPELCPRPRKRLAPYASASAPSTEGGRVYVVQEGDTLFDIARYELGDAARWVDIYRLNQRQLTNDFDYVKPGMKLLLPGSGKRSVDLVTQQPGDEIQR